MKLLKNRRQKRKTLCHTLVRCLVLLFRCHSISFVEAERDEYVKKCLALTEQNALFQSERAQIFRDATRLYQRGIVELELQIFLSDSQHKMYDKSFQCGSNVNQISNDFSSVLRHWPKCRAVRDKVPRWETKYENVCLLALCVLNSFPWMLRVCSI